MRTANVAATNSSDASPAISAPAVSTEVQSLIWTQLDGSISAGQAKVLRGILDRSKSARHAYVDAVEEHFGIDRMFR